MRGSRCGNEMRARQKRENFVQLNQIQFSFPVTKISNYVSMYFTNLSSSPLWEISCVRHTPRRRDIQFADYLHAGFCFRLKYVTLRLSGDWTLPRKRTHPRGAWPKLSEEKKKKKVEKEGRRAAGVDWMSQRAGLLLREKCSVFSEN